MTNTGSLETASVFSGDVGALASPRARQEPREPSLIELLSLTDWYRFVPESAGILLLIVVAQSLLPGLMGSGDAANAYWIPVLLMSGQYGIMGGAFATLAATAALFIGGLPPQSASQDFYAYAAIVAAQPCSWFTTALVLGGLRTLHIHRHAELQERLEQTELMSNDVVDDLQRAVAEIAQLENRIAGDTSTLSICLHCIGNLQLSDRRALVASFADVIRYGAGATSFSVYLNSGQALEQYLRVEDGVQVTAPATPLALAVLDRIREDTDPQLEEFLVDAACVAPIRQTVSAEPLGIIVCSRFVPSQEHAAAVRRLEQICRVLAALLPSCREPIREEREYADAWRGRGVGRPADAGECCPVGEQRPS